MDVTDTKYYLKNDLFHTSCLVISKFSLICTLRMRDISTMVIWALIYQDLKTCSVIPSHLSELAISKYGTVASYFGIGKMKILKIMRWNIYKIGAQWNVHYIITCLFTWVLWNWNWLETQCWMRKVSQTVCPFFSQFRLQEQYVRCMSSGMKEWNKKETSKSLNNSCYISSNRLPTGSGVGAL